MDALRALSSVGRRFVPGHDKIRKSFGNMQPLEGCVWYKAGKKLVSLDGKISDKLSMVSVGAKPHKG